LALLGLAWLWRRLAMAPLAWLCSAFVWLWQLELGYGLAMVGMDRI
jgi:hypothetical protein